MEHDDPKLFVAFDPMKLVLPVVVGLLLADVLFGFVLSMQLKAVIAHPWDNIGYTALILVLYAIVMVLNVCAICAVVIGILSIAFRMMCFVFRVCMFLLKQPVRLVTSTFRLIFRHVSGHSQR